MLTEKEGAILVRDPSVPDKLVGVYFVKGKKLENLRNRLYFPTIKPEKMFILKRSGLKQLKRKDYFKTTAANTVFVGGYVSLNSPTVDFTNTGNVRRYWGFRRPKELEVEKWCFC